MKKLLILMLIITFAGAAQGVYFEDNFDHITTTPTSWDRVNYLGWYEQSLANPYPGGPWTIGLWDGFISIAPADNIQRTQVAYNFVETFNYGMGEYDVSTDPDKVQAGPGYGLDPAGEAPGVLRIMSIDSYWVDGLNSGPFLYKMVGTGQGGAGTGDFVAEVEIVSQNAVWSNLGGLMARDPASAGDTTENWVYLTYFPEWSVGNHIRTTVGGVSTEMGIKGYPCDPYLRLERKGTTFYFYTSPDGVTYTSLPGLEDGVDRPDMPAELQVGIFQANYDAAWIGSMDFDNFVLIPEPATIALLGLGGLALIRRKR